jgi:aspartate-semialdehyde dehydrogenase
MGYKVAVVGATGNVGRSILSILAERKFPVSEVVALASRNSAGKEISFGETKILTVQDLEKYDFKGTHIGLFSPGASVSKIHAPRAAEAGCVVIDNTSYFRMMEDIPLVVPEVNAHALKDFRKRNIIANPNCSTIQMVLALKPLHAVAKIKRVVVSTYQSVSGAGKEGMDELYDQTKQTFVFDERVPKKFTKQIAYNVIPHIDVFMEDGSTKEEWKMVHETKKILDSNIEISATCVRVPVFVGHCESINIEFENAISPEEARDILEEAPGCVVVDRQENGGYATPIDAVGEDATYISRIRKDPTVKHGLNMWVVSDNVRKGAALNSIQIAEELIANFGL